MDDEFQNLYLNDLIIKISFINNRENYKIFEKLKTKLKYLKVKFKNNKKFYEMIYSINPQKLEFIKNILEDEKKNFIIFLKILFQIYNFQ